MTRIARLSRLVKTTHTIDQVYAGIPANQRCRCGDKASEHVVKVHRTATPTITCEACGTCHVYYVPVVK